MAAAGQQYDVLFTGGTVIDGTGAPRVRADVAVAGDRIAPLPPVSRVDPGPAASPIHRQPPAYRPVR